MGEPQCLRHPMTAKNNASVPPAKPLGLHFFSPCFAFSLASVYLCHPLAGLVLKKNYQSGKVIDTYFPTTALHISGQGPDVLPSPVLSHFPPLLPPPCPRDS